MPSCSLDKAGGALDQVMLNHILTFFTTLTAHLREHGAWPPSKRVRHLTPDSSYPVPHHCWHTQDHAIHLSCLRAVAMRLKSVKSIEKITKSMKMVSAAKLSKAERRVKDIRAIGEASTGECLRRASFSMASLKVHATCSFDGEGWGGIVDGDRQQAPLRCRMLGQGPLRGCPRRSEQVDQGKAARCPCGDRSEALPRRGQIDCRALAVECR